MTSFYCSEDIFWAKDFGKIVIISYENNFNCILEGVDALIWEYLTLNYSSSQLVMHLSQLLDISMDLAMATITKSLIEWEKIGLVTSKKVIDGELRSH